jgi:prolyl-tRNA synthetase
MAFEADVKRITQAGIGFAGPVGMKGKIRIIADNHVMTGTGMICGANETDYHLKDVVPGRDFEPDDVSDFSFAKGGDQCPVCKTGKLEEHRGIEVGQVFYLGTKYSLPMKCSFLDENGKEQPAVMGCYGIGVSRTMASAIEQNHDDKGIIWPRAIAPFEIAVIPLQGNKPEVVETAQRIYNELKAQGVDVCLDDRNEGAGFKLNDAELIGYPVQILIGSRTLEQGQVELLARRTMEKTLSTVAEATAQAMALLNRV